MSCFATSIIRPESSTISRYHNGNHLRQLVVDQSISPLLDSSVMTELLIEFTKMSQVSPFITRCLGLLPQTSDASQSGRECSLRLLKGAVNWFPRPLFLVEVGHGSPHKEDNCNRIKYNRIGMRTSAVIA